jgi:hypothetical protein
MVLSLSLQSVYPPAHPSGGDPAQNTPKRLNPAGVARFRAASGKKLPPACWRLASKRPKKQGNLEKAAISGGRRLSARTGRSIIFANGLAGVA